MLLKKGNEIKERMEPVDIFVLVITFSLFFFILKPYKNTESLTIKIVILAVVLLLNIHSITKKSPK